MPPCAQIDNSPNCTSRRAISFASVVTMRPPVAPNGWPIAIEPPMTLMMSGLISHPFQGWAAKGWEINPDIINVMGGSIAIGHPFGATGGRIVTTLANEMARRDVQFGLLSICAQGGMAIPVVLEPPRRPPPPPPPAAPAAAALTWELA